MKKKHSRRLTKAKKVYGTIVGPLLVALALAVVYFALWGLSTVFEYVNSFLLGTVWPWVKQYGWTIILTYAFIGASTAIFFAFKREKSEKIRKPRQKVQQNNQESHNSESDGDDSDDGGDIDIDAIMASISGE